MRFFSAVDIFIIIMITALSDAGTALNQLAWLKGVRFPPLPPPHSVPITRQIGGKK